MAENEEEPIVTLKGNVRSFFLMNGIMIIILFLMLISVIQVLIAGDISAGWTYKSNSHARSIFVFYLTICATLAYPYMRFLDIGNTYLFYENKLIIKKYYRKKTIEIPYKQMNVEIKKLGLLISKEKVPTIINPVRNYITSYYDGAIIPTNPIGKRENKWKQKDLEKAITIIKNKAAVVINK